MVQPPGRFSLEEVKRFRDFTVLACIAPPNSHEAQKVLESMNHFTKFCPAPRGSGGRPRVHETDELCSGRSTASCGASLKSRVQ